MVRASAIAVLLSSVSGQHRIADLALRLWQADERAAPAPALSFPTTSTHFTGAATAVSRRPPRRRRPRCSSADASASAMRLARSLSSTSLLTSLPLRVGWVAGHAATLRSESLLSPGMSGSAGVRQGVGDARFGSALRDRLGCAVSAACQEESQTSALTRLRHAPCREGYRHTPVHENDRRRLRRERSRQARARARGARLAEKLGASSSSRAWRSRSPSRRIRTYPATRSGWPRRRSSPSPTAPRRAASSRRRARRSRERTSMRVPGNCRRCGAGHHRGRRQAGGRPHRRRDARARIRRPRARRGRQRSGLTPRAPRRADRPLAEVAISSRGPGETRANRDMKIPRTGFESVRSRPAKGCMRLQRSAGLRLPCRPSR